MSAKFSALAANFNKISSVDTEWTVKKNREKRGMCGNCGTRTYSIVRSPMSYGQKEYIPLTIDGVVRGGRCLYCFPDKTNNGSNFQQIYQYQPCQQNVELQSQYQDPTTTMYNAHTNINSLNTAFHQTSDNIQIPIASVLQLQYDDESCLDLNEGSSCEDSMPLPSAPLLEYQKDNHTLLLHSNKNGLVTNINEKKRSNDLLEDSSRNIAVIENDDCKIIEEIINNIIKSGPNCPNKQLINVQNLNQMFLKKPRTRSFMSSQENMDVLLNVLVQYQKYEILEQHVCASIMILCQKTSKNRDILANLNSIDLVGKVLVKSIVAVSLIDHDNNIDKEQNDVSKNNTNKKGESRMNSFCSSCAALWSLCLNHEGNQKSVIANSQDLVSNIVKGMCMYHDKSLDACSWSCGLLSVLSFDKSVQQTILKYSTATDTEIDANEANYGIDILLTALEKYMKDRQVVCSIINIIWCMMIDTVKEENNFVDFIFGHQKMRLLDLIRASHEYFPVQAHSFSQKSNKLLLKLSS